MGYVGDMLLLSIALGGQPACGPTRRALPAEAHDNSLPTKAWVALAEDRRSMHIAYISRYTMDIGSPTRVSLYLDDGTQVPLALVRNQATLSGRLKEAITVQLKADILDGAKRPVALTIYDSANIAEVDLRPRGQAIVEACLERAVGQTSPVDDTMNSQNEVAPCEMRGRNWELRQELCWTKWHARRNDLQRAEESWQAARSIRSGSDVDRWRAVSRAARGALRAGRARSEARH
jgi:hypothetical protein